ncbi:MAG: ribose-phosphate pyrophosphokinase [Clostridiales bacterium]|jgi:ribose-phosphate pyrophosphokinase|nr:ribose-phosphate pyrophosphokinase [Clostridiales bacterium]
MNGVSARLPLTAREIDQLPNVTSGNILVYTCNSNRALAASIAKKLGIGLGKSEVGTFSDGEIYTRIEETIRGADIYIVQSTSPPVNNNLMELLIMIDAMKRASAGHINALIPYFGYARQDRKARARDPITAKLVANLLTKAGADRVITMDLHCAQLQGFFDIPVDHLHGQPILVEYYAEKFKDVMDEVTVVSPDLGSVSRSRNFAARLNAPLAIVDKRRPKDNETEVLNIIGDIAGKRVILADDIVDTAGTLTGAAKALLARGAKEVYACATHAVLSGSAIERLTESPITELMVLDTIDLAQDKRTGKIRVLSAADLFCEAIKRIHGGLSVSELFYAPELSASGKVREIILPGAAG